MKKAIVRAAMMAEDLELIGEFDRVDDEEYGLFVYALNDDVIIFHLGEDEGEIYELEYGKVSAAELEEMFGPHFQEYENYADAEGHPIWDWNSEWVPFRTACHKALDIE